MKLAIVTCTDGNYLIRSEHTTRDAALIAYDELHKSLVGDTNMIYGVIAIKDENLDDFEGRRDVITHPAPEPEPTNTTPTEQTQETQESENA